MKKTVWLLILSITFCLAGCKSIMEAGDGQKVYYWARPNTGAVWFAKDHRECLQEADLFPFEWPEIFGALQSKGDEFNMRFDNNAPSGVWANFIPFPGAQPIYMNSKEDDWSVDYDAYEECMTARHYHQRRPSTQNPQVFPM